MERQAKPALGKAKRDCIRALVCERLEQPTIDTIHAAGGRYCRECTYYETGTDDLPYCNCPDGGIADYPKPDDFCSYGLPKEDLS